MIEKNISQSFETSDHNKAITKVGDKRYNSVNRKREVLLRYLLDRLNMETAHINDKQEVRK